MTDISPDRFIDAVLSYRRAAAIKAALELDLFSATAGSSDTAQAPALAFTARELEGMGRSEVVGAGPECRDRRVAHPAVDLP